MAFDAARKEQELAAQSAAWDTSVSVPADPGDIPVVDVADYFRAEPSTSLGRAALDRAAAELRTACEDVGFYYLTGHGMSVDLVAELFEQTQRFHRLPLDTKRTLLMDRPGAIPGSGYLPEGNRKLPKRATGNGHEALVFKAGNGIALDDNDWLPEQVIPGFRSVVARYADAVQRLAVALLPVYAVALELPPGFFGPGFVEPLIRLRLTHYPPGPATDGEADAPSHRERADTVGYGIAPHVDTTFFTLLLQDSPGLTIYSAQRQQWIDAPLIDDAYVVNSGELLKQWSNDRFLSTRHYVRPATADRYSVPFFFNATADYPMACLPSCHSDDNPPRYPTISYLESQGVVQGE